KLIEEELEINYSLNNVEKLRKIIHTIISYKTDHFQLTSFIHRELSLDSTFVREMTVTYLAKENYILSKLFYSILPKNKLKQKTYLFMQLKGMIMSPYMLKHEWNNQMLDKQAYDNFINNYTQTID